MNYKADQFFLMDYSLSHWIRIYSKKELYNIYHRSASSRGWSIWYIIVTGAVFGPKGSAFLNQYKSYIPQK